MRDEYLSNVKMKQLNLKIDCILLKDICINYTHTTECPSSDKSLNTIEHIFTLIYAFWKTIVLAFYVLARRSIEVNNGIDLTIHPNGRTFWVKLI